MELFLWNLLYWFALIEFVMQRMPHGMGLIDCTDTRSSSITEIKNFDRTEIIRRFK